VLRLVGLPDLVRFEGLRVPPRCGWDLRHAPFASLERVR
jgi:hypothetical protein